MESEYLLYAVAILAPLLGLAIWQNVRGLVIGSVVAGLYELVFYLWISECTDSCGISEIIAVVLTVLTLIISAAIVNRKKL